MAPIDRDDLAFRTDDARTMAAAAKDRNVVLAVFQNRRWDSDQLTLRLESLRQRGLMIGIFRQPTHPAFTQTIFFADYGCIDIDQYADTGTDHKYP